MFEKSIVGYHTPGSRSLTLIHTDVIRNFVKGFSQLSEMRCPLKTPTIFCIYAYLGSSISNAQARGTIDCKGAGNPGSDGIGNRSRNLNLAVRSV